MNVCELRSRNDSVGSCQLINEISATFNGGITKRFIIVTCCVVGIRIFVNNRRCCHDIELGIIATIIFTTIFVVIITASSESHCTQEGCKREN